MGEAPDRVDGAVQSRAEAFYGRMLADAAGFAITLMCILGERFGLFRTLATVGPTSSAELSARSGLPAGRVDVWLRAMVSARYVEFDPESGFFCLPLDRTLVLAREGDRRFWGGALQILGALVERFDEAWTSAGGQPGASVDKVDELRRGWSRLLALWAETHLVREWLPALPETRRSLERGATAAEVCCLRGAATIEMASAFPRSCFWGFDPSAEALLEAAAAARAAAVADRVRFERRGDEEDLGGPFDVVISLHALGSDPAAGLARIRRALRPGGTLVCLEFRTADRLEETIGPLPALLFGLRALAAQPIEAAAPGLGESQLNRLCESAGFSAIRRVPVESAVHALYEVRTS